MNDPPAKRYSITLSISTRREIHDNIKEETGSLMTKHLTPKY